MIESWWIMDLCISTNLPYFDWNFVYQCPSCSIFLEYDTSCQCYNIHETYSTSSYAQEKLNSPSQHAVKDAHGMIFVNDIFACEIGSNKEEKLY